MNYFEDVTSNQAIAFHRLVKLMRRLRIIGNLRTNTVGHTGISYNIYKESYDSNKNSICQEELLESIYGKLRSSYPVWED